MSTPPQPQTPYTSFQDYNGWYSTGYSTGAMPTGSNVPHGDTPLFNVALVLGRANDPTAPGGLLTLDWAARQTQIQTMVDNDTLWSTYGAKTSEYNDLIDKLQNDNITILGQSGTDGYTTSQDSRTVWVQVTANNFSKLFGGSATLQVTNGGNYFWTGNLTLPDHVQGLWFDQNVPSLKLADSSQSPAPLTQGYQGPGNGAGPTANDPQAVAEYYNFPLAKFPNVPTPAIGLLESGLGASPPTAQSGSPQRSFEQLLGTYRTAVGLNADVTVIGVQPGGPVGSTSSSTSERSLDVGIATAVNPQSTLILYAGSGSNEEANANPFTSYFQAVWDTTYNPSVVSSSEHYNAIQPSPLSPFMYASQQLMVDAALRNISLFSSSGDGGSGFELANGLDNLSTSRASPYVVLVGGSSLSTVAYAQADTTLNSQYVQPAMANNPAVLWQLIAGGLTTAPQTGATTWFAESVWNRYNVTQVATPTSAGSFSTDYTQNESSNAGVSYTQPTPWYQAALLPFNPPTTSDGTNLTGRALPDVVATAGGNMFYTVPNADMSGTSGNGGTSSATPLWASFAVQMNTILTDQGFPTGTQLGYMTDLLYTASAIAPGSFNDVSIGNNVSSYLNSSSATYPYTTNGDGTIIPTGYGYYAGPGFDVATGLGSPNGVLLARALSAITHSQMYFAGAKDVLDSGSGGGWTSSVDQSLLLQIVSASNVAVKVTEGSDTHTLTSTATSTYAWTSRLAEQVLQHDFHPSLAIQFDGAKQGTLAQTSLAASEALAIAIDGVSAQAFSATMTNPFGFNDFQTTGGAVRVARPVAFAETALAEDDQAAVVRIRQNGTDKLSVTLYKVDDFQGAIGTLHPGDAGYDAAATARAYRMSTGEASIAGPGYGNFKQVEIVDVDASDIVAFRLANLTTGNTYWGFSQANETVNGEKVAHLWNYGLNTFGFEDRFGGGDRDYNDLLIGVDFTSASGSGWLK